MSKRNLSCKTSYIIQRNFLSKFTSEELIIRILSSELSEHNKTNKNSEDERNTYV